MPAKFSVASVTYRDLDQTKKFIDSIYATAAQEFEFIMVDNGCPEDLSKYLQEQVKTRGNFKVIKNGSNLGIGPAMAQAMNACSTHYIFRSDSDVVLLSNGWDKEMMRYIDAFPDVGAVGTSITGGRLIPRSGATASYHKVENKITLSEGSGYLETDLCLSNFMLIPRRTMNAIAAKAKAELPRVRQKVSEIIATGVSKWEGYFTNLAGLVDYMTYNAGLWEKTFRYGVDDFSYSMWIRYAGYRICKAPSVKIFHKDDSLRPDFSEERHRNVNAGFQQWRAQWEVLQDFFDIKTLDYDCWPMAKTYAEEQQSIFQNEVIIHA